jgi:hypothetical protein
VGESGTVITSTDGESWDLQDSLKRPDGVVVNLRGVRYVNGRFLAVGRFQAFESSDGLTWRRLDQSFTDTLIDCAYGDGTYVVVSEQGRIHMTSDLETWFTSPLKSPGELIKVLFHEGVFYAAGHGGVVLSTAPPDSGPVLPSLRIRRAGTQIRLEWDAPGYLLKSAPNLEGEWTELTTAVSPYTFTPELPMEYFQLDDGGP